VFYVEKDFRRVPEREMVHVDEAWSFVEEKFILAEIFVGGRGGV
jgi:hypothetical protein